MKKEIKKKKGLIDKRVTILFRCMLIFLICWFIIFFAVDTLEWQTLAKIDNTNNQSENQTEETSQGNYFEENNTIPKEELTETREKDREKNESIKKILRLTFVFVTMGFGIWLINLKNKNSSENQKGTKNE